MTFSVFHVSDLHFKNDHPSIERIHLLRDDMVSQAKKGRAYLVFSGDLVDAADNNLYTVLLDEFFLKLDSTFQRIYLVPGNHDVQWAISSEGQCTSFANDSSQSYLYDVHGKLKLENPFENIDPLMNYHSFQGLISRYQEENYFGSLDINSDFSFVGLNSAWLCHERKEGDTDLGKLKVDPAVVEYFAQGVDKTRLCLGVTHHPLEWITEKVRQQTKNKITSNFDLFLYGHAHNPTTTSGYFNGNNCLFLQSPALKSDDSLGNNAYSIINIDGTNKRYEIIYRTFSEPQNKFVPGVDIAENGVRYPTERDKKHWEHIKNSTKSGLHIRFEEKISSVDFKDWFKQHFVPKSKMTAEFIEPSVVRIEYSDGQRVETTPRKISKAIETHAQHQFVVGPQDSGLTTASFLIARHLGLNFDLFHSIPVYVNLQETKVNKSSLLREANRTSPVPYTNAEMRTLTEEGGVTFIFDQLGLPETGKFNRLIDTLNKYFPNCRSIIFCAKDGGLSESENPGELRLSPLSDIIFEIQELNVDGIHELVRCHRPSATQLEIDGILNNVVASFKQMDEPVFPSSAAVLLETLQQIPDFRPLNRVRLLDRYVECLLGRLDPDDVREGTFNSNDKINLLSYVAGVFATESFSKVTIEKWNEICRSYGQSKLLELPTDLLLEFTQKGVLILQNGSVTFRADYLFSYFVAKEMNLNPTVFSYISSQEAFYANHKEIVMYGELEGVDNSKILEETFHRLSSLEDTICGTYLDNGINFDEEWNRMISDEPEKFGQR